MKNPKLSKTLIINWLETFAILFLAWIIMSGIFEFKFLFYAVVSCAVIATICTRTLQIKAMKSDKAYFLLHINYARLIAYMGWLLVQIIKSAWYVSMVTLVKREEMNPMVVWFKVDYDNPIAFSMLANSITLTPGTITIDIKGEVFSVHALTRETAEGVLDGSMQQKVAWLFGEEIHFASLTDMTKEGKAND